MLKDFFVPINEGAILSGDRTVVQSYIDYELAPEGQRYGTVWKDRLPKGAPDWAAWAGEVGGAYDDLMYDAGSWLDPVVGAAAVASAYSETRLTYGLPGNPGGYDGKKMTAYGVFQPLRSTVASLSGVKGSAGWGIKDKGVVYWLSREGSRRAWEAYYYVVTADIMRLSEQYMNDPANGKLSLSVRRGSSDTFAAMATRFQGWGNLSASILKQSATWKEYFDSMNASSYFKKYVESVTKWAVGGRWISYLADLKSRSGGPRYGTPVDGVYSKTTPVVVTPAPAKPKPKPVLVVPIAPVVVPKFDVPPVKRRP